MLQDKYSQKARLLEDLIETMMGLTGGDEKKEGEGCEMPKEGQMTILAVGKKKKKDDEDELSEIMG